MSIKIKVDRNKVKEKKYPYVGINKATQFYGRIVLFTGEDSGIVLSNDENSTGVDFVGVFNDNGIIEKNYEKISGTITITCD